MAKQPVIAMKKLHGTKYIEGADSKIQLHLPKGCKGILFCFESKKAAREYWGKDIRLLQFDVDDS